MSSKFFRFLSKRGPKKQNITQLDTTTAEITPENEIKNKLNNQNSKNNSNNNNQNNKVDIINNIKHTKLLENANDLNLKESIEHYNQRCQDILELKQKNPHQQQVSNANNKNSIFQSFKKLRNNKKDANREIVNANNKIVPKDSIECAVIFLDDTQENFYLPKKSLGSKLYEQVFYHLDLLETDYFGLQFSDTHNVKHWLDSTKLIKKQCKIGPPYQFFFKVKFYTAEPNNLKEELTRYFYFLQLKQDLRSGKLTCSTEDNLISELCALILQEELGDYDSTQHTIETISEFRFLPDYQQTEQFEEMIYEKYAKSSSYKAMTPAEAELTFLNKAKWLEMYGVDMHLVYGRDQNEYKLGLTPSGILVFEETPSNNLANNNNNNRLESVPMLTNKIGLFYWPKIEKVHFSKKKFTILVAEDDNHGFKQEHTFIFNLIDEKACKHLWKCAVEYHAFFRLRSSPRHLMMLSSNNQNANFINGFIRRGSRFKGPDRTEFQTHNMARLTTPRRSVQFERRPSQRFSRRASYAIKRKLQEQQKLRSSQHQIEPPNNLLTIQNTNDNKNVVVAPQPKPRQSQVTGNNTSSNKINSSNSSNQSNQNALVPSLSDTKLNNNTNASTQETIISTVNPIANKNSSSISRSGSSSNGSNVLPSTSSGISSASNSVFIATPTTSSSNSSNSPNQLTNTTINNNNINNYCCKLQQSSNGSEHDKKCNLFKAQQLAISKSKSVNQTNPKTEEKLIDLIEDNNSSNINKPVQVVEQSTNELNEESNQKVIEKETILSALNVIDTKKMTSIATVPNLLMDQISITQHSALNTNVNAKAFTIKNISTNKPILTTQQKPRQNQQVNKPITTEI